MKKLVYKIIKLYKEYIGKVKSALKRAFAMFLCILMTVTSVPLNVFASDVVFDQTQIDITETLVEENYEINMQIQDSSEEMMEPLIIESEEDLVGFSVLSSNEQKDDILTDKNDETAQDVIPSSFDLRNVNGKNYITEIKSQLDLPVCWSFASIAAAESNYLLNGGKSDIDLSELKLAYSVYNNVGVADKLNLITNDGTISENLTGNPQIASLALASGMGFVDETKLPYNQDTIDKLDEIDASSLIYDSDYLLVASDWYAMSEKDTIKKAIMKNGALAVYCYFNGINSFYDYAEYETPLKNHALAIIGWDDNYDKNNFKNGKNGISPTQNGAWLVKDSLNSLYSWISYDEYSLNSSTAVGFSIIDKPYDYDIYQYDGSANTSTSHKTDSKTYYFDAVYTPQYSEKLDYVGLTTYQPDINYEFGIYTGYTDVTKPSLDGTLLYSKNGVIENAGYHLIKVEDDICVKHGQEFAVVVKYENSDGNVIIPLDKSRSGNINHINDCERGQTFFSKTGEIFTDYYDLEKSTARLKILCIPVSSSASVELANLDNGKNEVLVGSGDETDATETSFDYLKTLVNSLPTDEKIASLTNRAEIWQVKGQISYIKAYTDTYSSDSKIRTQLANQKGVAKSEITEEEIAEVKLTEEEIAYYNEKVLPVLNEKAELLDVALTPNGDYTKLADIIKEAFANAAGENFDFDSLSAEFKAILEILNTLPLTMEETGTIYTNTEIGKIRGIVRTNGSITSYIGALTDEAEIELFENAIAHFFGNTGDIYRNITARQTELNGAVLETASGTAISSTATLKTLFTNGGTGYLSGNFTLSEHLYFDNGKSVTLYMNGKTLTISGENKIDVTGGSTLTIKDTGTIQGSGTSSLGGLFYMYAATINLYQATLKGGAAKTNGGAIYLSGKANFNMYSGSITNCTAGERGGAIFAGSDSQVTMSGGEIKNCTADYGGAFYLDSGSGYESAKLTRLTISGGIVHDNTAGNAGAVWQTTKTEFIFSGGEIYSNKTTNSGNTSSIAVTGDSWDLFTLSGGYLGATTSGSNDFWCDDTVIFKSGRVDTGYRVVYSGIYEDGSTKLEAVASTVTLNRNGGSGGTSTISCTWGTNPTKITGGLPSRSGYTFGGYYDGEGGTGDKYFNSDGTYARKWDYVGPKTLYARWLISKPTDQSVDYNGSEQTYSLPENTFFMGGGKGTYPNTYTASIAPENGYGWSDGTTDSVTVNFVINKRPITLTPTAKTTAYGDAVPTWGYSITSGSLVSGESLSGTANYTFKNSGGTSITPSTTTVPGTYTISMSGLSHSYYNITFNTNTWTVSNAALTVTKNTDDANTFTYNGSKQGLGLKSVVAKNSQTVTIKYGTSASSCTSTSVLQYTDFGTYTVYYKATAPNHNESTGSFIVKINKADNPITVTNKTLNSAYNTAAVAISMPSGTVSNAQGTVTYIEKTDTSSKFTVNTSTGAVTVAAKTVPGNYTYVVTATAAGNKNYNSGSKDITYTIIVSKAANPITAPSALTWTPTFSTSNQTKTINAFTNNQGTLSYSISEVRKNSTSGSTVTASSYFSISSTTLTLLANVAVGTYCVKVKGTAAGNSNYESGYAEYWVTVTVIKAAVGSKPTTTSVSKTYNGKSQTNDYTKPTGVTLSGNASGTNYGTYTATYTPDSNHCWGSAAGGTDSAAVTVTLTIGKATLTPSLSYSSIDYNGKAQKPSASLSGFVNSESFTLNTDYTVTFPDDVTNAGDKSVTFALKSTTKANNYQLSATSKTYTINKVASTFSLNPATIYVSQAIDISTLVSGKLGSLTYAVKTWPSTVTAQKGSLSGSTYTAGVGVAGTDTDRSVVIKVTDSGDSNHNSTTKEVTITIQKYTPTLTWKNDTTVMKAGTTLDGAAASATAGGTAGTVTYSANSESYLTVNSSSGLITANKYSNSTSTKITATISSTTTNKKVSIDRNVAVNKGDSTITVTTPQSWSATYSDSGQDKTITAAANAKGSVTYSVKSQVKKGTTTAVTYFTTTGSNKITMAGDAPVGDYTVTIQAMDNGNDDYNSKPLDIVLNVSVSRASVGDKPTTTVSKVYTGDTLTNDYTKPSGVTLDSTNKYESGKNVGTYKATYTPDSNHKWSDNTTTGVTVTLTITNAALSVTANNQSYPYNGNPQGAAISAIGVDGLAAVVKYGSSAGACTSSTVPTITDFGSQTVYYEASLANHTTMTGSYVLEITKVAAAASAPVKKTNLIYSGLEQELINASSGVVGGIVYYGLGESTTVEPTSWSTSIPKAAKAVTYYVWYKVEPDTNHTAKSAAHGCTVSIAKKELSISFVTSPSYTYDKTEKKPEIKIDNLQNGETFTLDTDYSLTYSNNINAGTDTASVKLTLKSTDLTANYTVSDTGAALKYTISPYNIGLSEVTVSNIPENHEFEGTYLNPNPSLTGFGAALINNTDYTFAWNTNVTPSETAPYSADQTLIITGKGNYTGTREVTYKETRKSYTVTYNGNGTTDNVPEQGTKYYGVPFTVTSNYPNRTGATFRGWAYSEVASLADDIGSTISDKNENIILYAIWSFKVTLHPNNGTIHKDITEYTYILSETALPSTEDEISRVGYDFLGWFDNVSLEGTAVSDIPAQSTGAKEFWAKWQAKTDIKYIVKHVKQPLNDDGYTLGEYPDVSSKLTSDTDLGLEVENLTGTADSKVSPEVKSYDGFKAPKKQEVTISPDGSLVVVYQYARRTDYLVEFSIAPSSKGYGTVNSNTYAMIPNIPYEAKITVNDYKITITGFDILALAKENEGEYEYKFDKWTDYDENSLPQKVTESIGIYAHFNREGRKYTVTVHKPDGTTDPLSVPYGTKVTEIDSDYMKPNAFTKPDDKRAVYTFNNKWSKTEGGQAEDLTVLGDMSVYPVFDESIKSYEVHFNAVGGYFESALVSDTDIVITETESPFHIKEIKALVPYGSLMPADMPVPEKDNDATYEYTWIGWKVNSDGTGSDAPNVDESGFTGTGGAWVVPTYYAIYNPSLAVPTYKLTIKPDDGTKDYGIISQSVLSLINSGSRLKYITSTDSSTLIIAKANNTEILASDALARTEDDFYTYDFVKWNIQKKIGDTDENDGSLFELASNTQFVVSSNIEASAVFKRTARKYDIAYKENDETSIELLPIQEYEAAKETSLPEPSKTGFEFLGWSTEKNGTEYITKISPKDYGHKTFYAQWNEINEYNLSLKAEPNYGGNLFDDSSLINTALSNTISENDESNIQAQKHSEQGTYDFDAWYVNGKKLLVSGTNYNITDSGNVSILRYKFTDEFAENDSYEIVAKYKYHQENDGVILVVKGSVTDNPSAYVNGSEAPYQSSTDLNIVTKRYEIEPFKTVTLKYEGSGIPEWRNEKDIVVSNEKEYTFKLTVSRQYSLTTLPKEEDVFFVEARNDFNQVIAGEEISSIDELTAMFDEAELTPPARLGKSFSYWALSDGTKLTDITDISVLAEYITNEESNRVIFYPEYENSSDVFTIKVHHHIEGMPTETVTASYKRGENITLTAKDYNGLFFKGWYADEEGKIALGASTAYPLHVGEDRDLHAFYSTKKASDTFPTIRVSLVTSDTDCIYFQTTRDIPDNVKLLGHGVIRTTELLDSVTTDASIESYLKFVEFLETGNVTFPNDSKIKCYFGEDMEKHSGLTYKLNVGAGSDTVYIRGFIIYEENNNQFIKYTDVYVIDGDKNISKIIKTSTPDPSLREEVEDNLD